MWTTYVEAGEEKVRLGYTEPGSKDTKEYKGNVLELLNELGEDGWELGSETVTGMHAYNHFNDESGRFRPAASYMSRQTWVFKRSKMGS